MKSRVQMPANVTAVSVDGVEYTADEHGVVHLDNPEHVAPLLSHGGVELGEDGKPGHREALVGTGKLPLMLDVGADEPMQLRTLVLDTHALTGISADQWNNLPQEIRDILLGYQLAVLRGEIGNVGIERGQREEAVAENDRLRGEVDALNARIEELEKAVEAKAAPAPEEEAAGAEGTAKPDPVDPTEKPDFAAMSKAQLNAWLAENGADKAVGDQDFVLAAAEARWAVLHPAEPAAS